MRGVGGGGGGGGHFHIGNRSRTWCRTNGGWGVEGEGGGGLHSLRLASLLRQR